ncbi:MAG: SUMF1/EgtB/PvdO family nonheme iron enzyme [Alphaproteobacteria bacterium]
MAFLVAAAAAGWVEPAGAVTCRTSADVTYESRSGTCNFGETQVFEAPAVTRGAEGPPPAGPGRDITVAQSPGERRVALVIGNATYASSPLANPVNDARAMTKVLRSQGFEVIVRENATKAQMEDAVATFGEKLGPGVVGLVYYSGHGMQVGGRNFLIPVDANITSEQTVALRTLDADRVLEQMTAAQTRVNVVILDACRNNPFERRFRAVGGGLAQMNAPRGTIVAYATAPGKVASDGAGSNGLYTSELLKAMSVPGMKVEEVFKQVRVAVAQASSDAQIPWEASSLTGDFYFKPGGGAGAGGTKPPVQEVSDSDEAGQIQAELAAARTETERLKLAAARAELERLKAEQENLRQQQVAMTLGPSPGLAPSGGGSSRAPGTAFRDCPDCPEMVVVPPGGFSMGSNDGEDDEKPPHWVTIARAFAVGKTEVTVGQWSSFVTATGHSSSGPCSLWTGSGSKWEVQQGASWRSPGFSQTEQDPVVCISWDDAQAYIQWLNNNVRSFVRASGSGPYRLLTESEWEYAARAGSISKWSCGGDESCLDGVAWYNNKRRSTRPVAGGSANAFGLYDMHGNAAEWTGDCYGASYVGAPSDGTSRTGADGCRYATRGGGWVSPSSSLRSSYHNGYTPSAQRDFLGFRLARTL